MNRVFTFVALLFLIASCTSEIDQVNNISGGKPSDSKTVFFASTENTSFPNTKVYADERLRVLWNADDRISVFNKNTYNYQYVFTGDDGDTAGGFEEIPVSGLISGNSIDNIYAVYPYSKNTKMDNDGVLTMMLPAEQKYKEKSFGIGANTMVAVTDDNFLAFKNVGGYLSFRLYGDNVKVKSVMIKGNSGEKIAGKAFITMPLGGTPSISMDETATDAISIICEQAVTLGATADEYTDFWFVIPPVTFEQGFTIKVIDELGGTFEKSTSKSFTVSRNMLDWMNPIEVIPDHATFNIEFADPEVKAICVDNWDENHDGELSNEEAANVTDLGNDFQYSDITSFNELRYFIGITRLDETFKECFLLEEIMLPDRLTGLGTSVFEGCENLKEILIPSGVTYIGSRAFYGCSKLEGVTIPTGVTCISYYAFYGCSILTEISIPSSVTQIENHAFEGCSSLTTVSLPEGLTTIGACSFCDCVSLNAISIPESVTTIMDLAFTNCSSLNSISIPESVTEIQNNAFAGCSSLTTVNMPENLRITSIASSLFSGCSALQSITIPYRVRTIDYGAFDGCANLTEVIIPSNSRLTSIGNYAFQSCSSLTSITIPNSVISIGYGVFSGCSNLTSITLPDSVTSIGQSAFSGCSNLTEVIMPSNSRLTSIGNFAFYSCSSLTSITLPDSVTSIGNSAFYSCSSLTSITLPDSVTSIGDNVFSGCTSLTSITIPDNVTSIGFDAFQSCSSLTSIILPNILTSIGYGAFASCSNLTSITIPESVTSIGNYAFQDCRNLTSMQVEALNPPSLGNMGFWRSVDILVPASSVNAYKTASGWSDYADWIQAIPE